MANFLTEKSEPKYPNRSPCRTYTVIVQFVVDINGTITDITYEPWLWHGKRSREILKLSPKWNAAEQENKKVKTYLNNQSLLYWRKNKNPKRKKRTK